MNINTNVGRQKTEDNTEDKRQKTKDKSNVYK